MPKVSVIIPTYNREKYIVETLQSVFAQTFTDHEVIVIDDGSTDNTADLLKPYLDRIIYIRKPNGGQGSARNVGIKIAKGEYIAFLDSDDLWMPEKLEKQVKYLDEHRDVGLVFTDYVVFSEDSPSPGPSPSFQKGGEGAMFLFPSPLRGEGQACTERSRRGGGELREKGRITFTDNDLSFHSLFRRNFISNLTVMVRSDCFKVAGFFDESRDLIGGEDYEMWLRIAMKYKLGHIPEILAKYRVHPDNVLGTDLEKGYIMHIRVIQAILKKFPDIPEVFNISMDEYYRDFYYRFGRDLYQAGYFFIARKYLKISLKKNILSPKAVILFLFSWLKSSNSKKDARP